MKKFISVMILAIAVFFLGCDETSVNQKMYGGYDVDGAYCIEQTSDGGYIIAGHSNSTDISGVTGNGRIYVIKFDSSGNVVWQKLYGGSNSTSATSIQQTSDGGYIVAGHSDDDMILVLKLDSNGNMIWEKTYGGGRYNHAYSIRKTSDGGYIIAGTSFSTDISGVTNNGSADVYVIKLDGSGNTTWQSMYGGSGSDDAYAIKQTSDGGYIVAGHSNSTDISGVTNHGAWDAYVIKLNSSGNVAWQNMYGGARTNPRWKTTMPPEYTTSPGNDHAYDVVQRDDGGYVVVGKASSADISGVTQHGSSDVYVVILDANGAL